MKINKIKSYAPFIGWMLFGFIGLVISHDYMGPLPTFKLGAAFWPQVILLGIILVSGIQLFLLSFFQYRSDRHDVGSVEDVETQSDDFLDKTVSIRRYTKASAIFILPLVYVYGMHKIGFFIVTPIFLPLYMFVMGVRSIRRLIFVAVGVCALLLFLFVYLAFTPLPQGAGYFHSLNGEFLALFQ